MPIWHNTKNMIHVDHSLRLWMSAVKASLRYSSDHSVVLFLVVLVSLGCIWIGRTSTVGIREQALNGCQYGTDIVAR